VVLGTQLVRKRIESIGRTRNEHQIVAIAGEQLREF
jgi:hypothetical protein